ncbi:MAG: sensor domain-containing diguanylate cyclase [Ilumatobacter sp.]|uniref:diguanylate cyclase domain-containing protein n=1 Tax=Ilumatobacter sp. TaxID=1967498 RepID=UPI003C7745F3
MKATTIVAGIFGAMPGVDSSWMLDVLSEPINRYRVSDRVITYSNVAWANHYGVPVSEAVGRCLDDFLSIDELDGLYAQLELLGPDEPVLMDTVARLDSGATQRWLQWVDHYVVTEHGPEIISVGRDVTDRHVAVRALAESENRFRTLADQSSDIVWRIRRSRSGFDYLSPATLHILGFEPDHFIEGFGRLLEISEPETRITLERLLAGDDLPELIDLRVRHVDGRSVILESSVSSSGDVIQGVGRDVTEIRNLQSTLEESASTDALTGLANRRSFDRSLDSELARTADAGTALGVVYIDLDKLKPINDRFGHDAGDLVLKEAARRLVACADGADIVARVGGDEFVILHEVRGDSIERVVKRLHERLELPMSISRSLSVVCSASVGVAETSSLGKTASELVAAADRAMYEAKQQLGG